MSPYYILGVPEGAHLDVARQAYRRLAMQHHPDRGGDAEVFKQVQNAWELINSGKWTPPPKPEPPKQEFKSAFNNAKSTQYNQPQSKPPKMPEVTGHGNNKALRIVITENQAFMGCTVPFRYGRHIIDFEVRPGTRSHTSQYSFAVDPTIGAITEHFSVRVTVEVGVKETAQERADMTLRVQLFALSFIIGGTINVTGARGEKVAVTIPEGHDPSRLLRVQGYGYGPDGSRGDLILQFEAVYKSASYLSENERAQVTKLYKYLNQ